MEAAPSKGILGAWLRRNAEAPTSPQPVSPTWSEASEDSITEAALPATPEPAPQPAASMTSTRSTSPVQTERMSWLTRLSGAYNHAVRGGAKALQKLTTRDRLQDYAEAKERLERTAAELEGENRVLVLKRWAAILGDLCSHPQPPAAAPISPGSHCSDPDWQQLQVTSPTAVAQSSAAHEGRGMTEGESGLKADEVLFVDWGQPGAEPVTFRELFLRSQALHILTAGYAAHPPQDGLQEREALVQLFGTCLSNDSTLHAKLTDLLLAASHTLAGCRRAGTDKAHVVSISESLSRSVAALKLKAEVEVLDRKMGVLQQDINAQAAAAAQAHKFNSGTAEPSGDCSPQKLASGVSATAEVMHLAEKLAQLGQQRRALVKGAAHPPLEAALVLTQQRLQLLEAALSQAEGKIATTTHQQRDGETFRGRKLAEMEKSLTVVQAEVAGLDERKAALLNQLAQVDALLAQAHARKADLEEGRNVFEEGNSFTLDALQHQLDELSHQQRQDTAESAALKASGAVLATVQAGHALSRLAAESAAERVAAEAMREYGHAATRHLYFQRAQAQLLLRQLRFCAGELQGSASKQEHMTQMGMGRLLADVQAQRHRLQQQYLDAESAATVLFQDISAVQHALEVAGQQYNAQSAPLNDSAESDKAESAFSMATPADVPSAAMSEELQGLLESIEGTRTTFVDRERPSGLPLPGQPLPRQPSLEGKEDGVEEATGPHSADESAGTASNHHVVSMPPELGGVTLPQVASSSSINSQRPTTAAAAATDMECPSMENPIKDIPSHALSPQAAATPDDSASIEHSQPPTSAHRIGLSAEKVGSDSADDAGFLEASSGDEIEDEFLVDAAEDELIAA